MKKKISQITNNKGAELLAALGGDEPVKGYAPSTPEQRANWNKLLRFVYERGLSGSKDLDRKDQSLGYKILEEYNKLNPKNQVPKEFIQIAQYENDLIRRKGAFPKLGEDESATIYEFLPPMYKSKEVSPVDGWLGSRTSQLAYPIFSQSDNMGGKVDYGTDYESFIKTPRISEILTKYRTAKSNKIP